MDLNGHKPGLIPHGVVMNMTNEAFAIWCEYVGLMSRIAPSSRIRWVL